MISNVAVLLIMLMAVVFGIFKKRRAVACAMFVLHVAIGSFIYDCVSHWATEHPNMASPSGKYTPAIDRG